MLKNKENYTFIIHVWGHFHSGRMNHGKYMGASQASGIDLPPPPFPSVNGSRKINMQWYWVHEQSTNPDLDLIGSQDIEFKTELDFFRKILNAYHPTENLSPVSVFFFVQQCRAYLCIFWFRCLVGALKYCYWNLKFIDRESPGRKRSTLVLKSTCCMNIITLLFLVY